MLQNSIPLIAPVAARSETSLSVFLDQNRRCVLVDLSEARGSTPRERGTFMLVAEASIWGTIGGGQFEYMAIDNARALLSGSGETRMDIPLGPEIGQCCGGWTRLTFTLVTPAVTEGLRRRLRNAEQDQPAIFVFGAGHVGRALAHAVAPLPFSVTLVETRIEALQDLPGNVAHRLAAIPEAVVGDIPEGGAAIIMTHDHALDFLIARQALSRPELPYVGMIGSATKRATFAAWARREGMPADAADRLVLPIGGSAVKDKRPAVIAAMVAAELLTVLWGTRVKDRAAER